MTQIIAIAAHKGGVGKTTTAISLSAALARSGASSLLVDLDPQGHSTIGLGVTCDENRTVWDILADRPVALETVTYPTSVPQLHVVPATIRLERQARTLLGRSFREHILRTALERAGDAFDWVLIDCPPSLGTLVENALVAANRVIVPCRSEARGADGLIDLLEVLDLVNPVALDACQILRTQRHGARSTANELLELALEPFRNRVLSTVVPQCDDLNHAQVKGVDIFGYAPRSTGAAAYAQLAGEVRRAWGAGANSRS